MKKLLTILLACLLLGTVSACASYTASDWAKNELAQAEEAGLIPDTLAEEDLSQPITRLEYAQSAMTLYNTLAPVSATGELPAEADTSFSDCGDSAVAWAYQAGIVKGFPDGTFRPDALLTREQAATMLLRVCDCLQMTLPAADGTTFSDRDAIGDWALKAVETMAAADVIQGRPDGTFAPDDTVTRQEALVMNDRVRSYTGNEETPTETVSFGGELMSHFQSEVNPVLSPVSVQLALGLLQPGAAGQTEQELNALLEGADFAQWMDTLKTGESGPTVEVANSLWFDTSVTPDKDYLNTLSQTFDAESRTVTLSSKKAVTAINSWVKEKTHDLIPSLLDAPLGEDAAAVLINALYFKGTWAHEFAYADTWEQTFRNASGEEAEIPFMHDTRHGMTYLSGENFTGVSLPYAGEGDWQLICLLPKEGTAPEELAKEDFAALLSKAEGEYVNLSLPKFTLEGTYNLKDTLTDMGLTTLFTPDADLTPMGTCTKGPLMVSSILQKTYLRVDETGTEAAAVTAIMAEASAVMPTERPISLTFDRPFLCCLWSGELNQPLFLAAVEELG